MNLPKSVFTLVFVTWLALLGVYGFIQLARGMEPILSWLGLLLSAAAPLLFFTRELLFRSSREFRHPLAYSAICGLGLAMTMAMSFRHGPAAGLLHVWAGITLIGWIAYLRWFGGTPGN